MNVGSLFSGIGGFDLGLERAGMSTSWFCEQDTYCQRVLNRHWPNVPVYPDVTQLNGTEIERVDVLAGGFPCQDLSLAGKGAGITGARSGLWSEFARLISEIRPRYVIVENVPALLGRGFGTVLGNLATLGFDAEWDCIPASAVGAPHRRDRVWVVAYPGSERFEEQCATVAVQAQESSVERSGHLANTEGKPKRKPANETHPIAISRETWNEPVNGSEHGGGLGWWEVEPEVGRVADGFPGRVDQLAALGNALVPQIAEWIGHRIMRFEEGRV